MKDSSSFAQAFVAEDDTLTILSEISAVPISLEDNTSADYPIFSIPIVQQKSKYSNIFSKTAYFIFGSIFIFLGLGLSLKGVTLWSLLCFLIGIIIFKFEVSHLIAPTKPKFLHLVLYIGYLAVASIRGCLKIQTISTFG